MERIIHILPIDRMQRLEAAAKQVKQEAESGELFKDRPGRWSYSEFCKWLEEQSRTDD